MVNIPELRQNIGNACVFEAFFVLLHEMLLCSSKKWTIALRLVFMGICETMLVDFANPLFVLLSIRLAMEIRGRLSQIEAGGKHKACPYRDCWSFSISDNG